MKIVQKLRRALRLHYTRSATAPDFLNLGKIGSDYGGWFVPTGLLDKTWIVYSGGVGEDITFDLGLIAQFGLQVFAFDPTPRAAAHVEANATNTDNFNFMPVGLWSHNTTLRFYVPQNPEHVSHSVMNLQETDDYFEAPCRSLPSLMEQLNHTHIDLLKIDIEGAEHEVIRSMFEAKIAPKVINLEIDQPVSPVQIYKTVRRVKGAGYKLVHVDGWNFTFIKKKLLSGQGKA